MISIEIQFNIETILKSTATITTTTIQMHEVFDSCLNRDGFGFFSPHFFSFGFRRLNFM